MDIVCPNGKPVSHKVRAEEKFLKQIFISRNTSNELFNNITYFQTLVCTRSPEIM